MPRFTWRYYVPGFVVLTLGQSLIYFEVAARGPSGPVTALMFVGGVMSAAGTTMLARGEPPSPTFDSRVERLGAPILATLVASVPFLLMPGLTALFVEGGLLMPDLSWLQRLVVLAALSVVIIVSLMGLIGLHRMRFIGSATSTSEPPDAPLPVSPEATSNARRTSNTGLGRALVVAAFIILCALTSRHRDKGGH